MAKSWTDAQLAAINTHNKTLLVSAAAGSGKTTTLIERIIRSITDEKAPADISKMLIATYTRSSAEDLKSRIFDELSNALANNTSNPKLADHLTNQLVKLGSAHIGTIDSFYLELIRANFSTLELPASFRIADDSELSLLSLSVMEDIVEKFYESEPLFPAFADCLITERSASFLPSILIKLEDSAHSIPQGIEFFRINAEETKKAAKNNVDFLSTTYGKVIREYAIDILTHAHSVFSAACDYFETDPELLEKRFPAFDYDRQFCHDALIALSHPDHAYEITRLKLQEYHPISLQGKRLSKDKVTEESKQFQDLRTTLKKDIDALYKKSFSKSQETISRAMRDTADYIELLYRVLAEYQKKLSEEKALRQILSFHDIRAYALKLLIDENGDPTSIAKQYANEFTHVYIDEYQDVDRIQNQTFIALSKKNNRFMVGDVKQSIYSFRGAEPTLFSGYRSNFPDYEESKATGSEEATIFMSENFRCDEPIIDFTNLVCDRIFSACKQTLDYQPKDRLIYAKDRIEPKKESFPVEITVISSKNVKGATSDNANMNLELEAAYIAKEIERLLLTEKKANGEKILPEDITILFRSRKIAPFLTEALKQRGILCSESDAKQYFEKPEVLMFLALLNTIDNPHRDIHLTGTLRSPLFGFDMNEIIEIRHSADKGFSLYDALLCRAEKKDELGEKCRRFNETLMTYRRDARAMPVDHFIRTLFESDRMLASGLLSDFSTVGGGNLLRLYEYARSFESGSFKGLYNFIEFINTLIEESQTINIPTKGVSKNRVKLMTVHGSKGLEFPICFVCGNGIEFNFEDLKKSLIFKYPSGVAMKIGDSTGFARINTPMRQALSLQLKEVQVEEEMRLLYVALTRASERLYVTAATSLSEDDLKRKALSRVAFCGKQTLLTCNKALDWLLLPFADSSCDTSCAKISFLTPTDIELSPSESQTEELSKPVQANQELLKTLKEAYSFQYPHRDLQKLPAKISVSRLSPDVLDENDTSANLFEKQKTHVPDFFLPNKPSKASASDRGTATHLFLQFCDFSYAEKHGAEEERSRLVANGFISSTHAEILYLKELEAFLQSELFAKIKNAKKIYREQRFNLLLSPEDFTKDADFRAKLVGESLAVQGVIDLILVDEHGDITLVDYKTDRLKPEEQADDSQARKTLQSSHGLQLSYYAHAVEQLFGRPCKNVCIYSTHAAKLFDITPSPLTFTHQLLDIL